MEKYAESSGRNEKLETSVGSKATRRDNSQAFGRLCCSSLTNQSPAPEVPILTLEPPAFEATLERPDFHKASTTRSTGRAVGGITEGNHS
jgi:hypothetical protein